MAVASSINFSTITKGMQSLAGGLNRMKTSTVKMTKIVSNTYTIKRKNFAESKILTARRNEMIKIKDREEEIESSSTRGKIFSRPYTALASSTKGFLGRIMDFLGSILVGWLIYNLPSLITMVTNTVSRIWKLFGVVSNFVSNLLGVFVNFGGVLGSLLQNVLSLDFLDDSKRLQTAMDKLNGNFDQMGNDFRQGMGLLTTPLGQGAGEQQPAPMGTKYETPSGAGSMKGGSGEQKTMSFLISYGLTSSQAAGIAGNLQQESHFDPNADNGTHHGIAQWDKQIRWPRVSAYIKSIGKDPNTLEGQLYGLVWEAQARGDWRQIQGTKSARQSSAKWLERFEISGEKAGQRGYENRMTNASNLEKKYADYDPGKATASGPTKPIVGSGGKVIEYLTGDKTSPRYRADHAGNVYHDHIAFDSQATRDAAMKFLTGKGWTIGSINTGKHAAGSYHYSNQAFDIPFYPNQSRKGVPDNAKGETALSSRLRADLIAGGFSGSQLGGGSAPSVQVASQTAPSPGITPQRTGPQVTVVDNSQRSLPPMAGQVAQGGAPVIPSGPGRGEVLNSMIKQQILLDLAYT
jgi:hypothetical protein